MVLQAIRERLTGIIAVFIFAILIIPFAFVGVNSYFTSDTVNSVARVNDVDITTAAFSQGFQNYRRRMQSLMGANFDAEQFDQPIIRRQYLDSMIDQELLNQVSLEYGLTVDDASLAQAIRDVPAFQLEGEFNQEIYLARLTAQGSTAQKFENDMRAQLILGQFPDAITSSSIATDWELGQFVRLQDQQRAFKAIVVPVASTDPVGDVVDDGLEVSLEEDSDAVVEDDAVDADAEVVDAEITTAVDVDVDVDVDDEAIAAWYESHQQLYRSTEEVAIEYLELDAAGMGQDLVPDDEQLRARFEEQKARFITPEARLASHILIQVDPQADELDVETARQLAQDMATRAQAGEDFAALATEFSQDAGSASLGGDLGWVEPGFMVQAFEDGLYALSLENPISEPVQTGFGWHIIELRDVRPAEGMSFEEAREVLLSEYFTEFQEREFLEQADRLVDIIYEDPTTLNAAAEELGLEVQQLGPFGRSGGEGIAANPEVVSAAFSDLVLLQGVVSDPVDLGENHIVMIRVKEHFPEDLLPLDEVRDSVIASVRHERALQDASARADEILAQIGAGADITTVAEEQALELLKAEAAQRTDRELPADLLVQVFLLMPPEGEAPRTAIVSVANGFAVVQLESVTDGVVSEEDLVRMQTYRTRIANASANAEFLGFMRMLRKQSEIEVFEERL